MDAAAELGRNPTVVLGLYRATVGLQYFQNPQEVELLL